LLLRVSAEKDRYHQVRLLTRLLLTWSVATVTATAAAAITATAVLPTTPLSAMAVIPASTTL
jgi:hypothetical protein